jgi:hypothetical protein
MEVCIRVKKKEYRDTNRPHKNRYKMGVHLGKKRISGHPLRKQAMGFNVQQVG